MEGIILKDSKKEIEADKKYREMFNIQESYEDWRKKYPKGSYYEKPKGNFFFELLFFVFTLKILIPLGFFLFIFILGIIKL